MTIRLYYNKHGELPWSVDEGTQASEKQVKEVSVFGVYGCTRVAAIGPEYIDTAPTAWLEFSRAEVKVIDGTAVIFEAVGPHRSLRHITQCPGVDGSSTCNQLINHKGPCRL